MLDNLMVGAVGTSTMTGVAVANQLIFIFNLCIYGAISGVGIFTAQFFGKADNAGVRYTFRFKMIICFVTTILFTALIILKGDLLLGLFLKGEGRPEDAAASARIARDYINIILIGILPYALTQCFGSTLRETGRPKTPMYAGILAVFLNLILNYMLIFGHLGFPRMGARGAATATVISRFAELFYVVAATYIGKKSAFIRGAFRSMRVPLKLVGNMAVRGMPLMLNELLWSLGIVTVNQCYSLRGLDVVAADNIALTFFNLFSVVFMSVGVAIGIIVGQMLGAGKTGEVMDTAVKMRVFSVFTGVIVGVILASLSGVIPMMYNTTAEVRHIAGWLIILCAAGMPIDAFAHASYFTLRSGGKIIITMIFDSFFVWLVSVPFAFVISRYTAMPIIPFFALSQALNIIKCVLGYFYVKKGSWIKNLVGNES